MKRQWMNLWRNCLVGVVALPVLMANGVTFPKAGGDISSSVDWEGPVPGSADSVVFDKDGTYVAATGDVTFSNVTFSAKSATFDLSATPTRTISYVGKTEYKDFYFVNGGVTVFKGGHWKSTKKTGVASLGYKASNSGNTVILDGADLSDIHTFYVGYSKSTDGRLVLTNAASLVSTVFNISHGDGKNNRVEVHSGSTLTTGTLQSDVSGSSGEGLGYNSLLVKGKRASVSTEKLVVGAIRGHNTVAIEDGGLITVSDNSGVVIGSGTSCDNRLVVSNATLTLSNDNGSILIGKDAGSGRNSFCMVGSESKLDIKGTAVGNQGFPFKAGSNNSFELRQGAAFALSGVSLTFSPNAFSNAVRLTSGARLSCKHEYLSSAVAGGWGNAIEIGVGATNDITGRLIAYSHDNRVVLSNGVFRTTSANRAALALGETTSEGIAAGVSTTNNVLRFEGETPSVKLVTNGAGVSLKNGSRLEFALPPGGYQSSHVPIQATYCDLDESCSIVIDATMLDNVSHGRLNMTLCETTGTPSYPKTVMDRANASLPEGMVLSYAEDKAAGVWRLKLSAKGNGGLMLLLR